MTYSLPKIASRLLALTISASLIVISPGFGALEALANTISAPVATQGVGGVNVVAPVVLPGSASLGAPGLSGSLGSGNISLKPALPGSLSLPAVKLQSLQSAPAAGVAPAATLSAPAAASVSQVSPSAVKSAPAAIGVSQVSPSAVSPKSAPAAASVSQVSPSAVSPSVARSLSAVSSPKQAAGVSARLGEMSKGVSAALESVGSISQARPERAYALGGELHGLLSGASRGSAASDVVAPRAASLGTLGGFESSGGRYFGEPAGKGSIEAAVRAYNAAVEEGPAAEAPPAQEQPATPQAPLAARIFAGLVAAAPAALLGVPLLMAGSTLAGVSVILASLSLMAMPFMGQKTPKLVRTLPGFAVMGLGAVTLVSGLLGGTGIAMGALVALGGWGLVRFGKQEDKQYFDEGKMLTAFFGALGAVAGAGLVAIAPAALIASWLGWIPGIASVAGGLSYGVAAARWLSYPLAAMLLMHLPGWVGEGIGAAVDGLYQSPRAVSQALVSLEHDTVIYKRLTRYSEAKLELSVWNVFKVGALWIPLWVAEAAAWLGSVAAGLALGAVQAPTMFLWGAAHKLAPESSFAKFMASWNRYVFFNAQGSKNTVYNKLARPFAAGANSESALVSVPSMLGLRLAQLGWLAYALAATPVLYVVGFAKAFAGSQEAYDRAKHDPINMHAETSERPVQLPELGQGPAVKDLIPPGIFATALALLPAYFFGLPIVSVTVFGPIYLAVAATVAAMPILPAKTPKGWRKAPGFALAGLGLLTMLLLPWLSFSIGLAGTPLALLHSGAFWMGLTTFLGGLGLVNVVDKLSKAEAGDQGSRKSWVNEPEYIGAFFGALGLLTGTGVALAGATGLVPTILTVAAYVASPALLVHLPKWFWTGIGNIFRGAWGSAEAFYGVLGSPWRDTQFYKNLSAWTRYYLNGSVWKVAANATWLSLVWVPLGILALGATLLSGALGLAMGALRAPANWLWGAAYDASPDSRFTRFMAGFVKSWMNSSEGSKRAVADQPQPLFTYDGMVKTLIPAMNEKHPVTSRPTLKAVGAALAARLLQAVWLAAQVLGLPVFLVKALIDGVRNASGVKPPPGEHGWDFDNPRTFYRYRDYRR